MKNSQKKLAKKYLQQVKAKIPYQTQCSKHVLQNLALSIEEYALENPDFEMEQLIENFGSPEDIASTLLEDVDSKNIVRSIKLKHKLFCVIVVLLILFVFCIFYRRTHQGIKVQEVIYTSGTAISKQNQITNYLLSI